MTEKRLIEKVELIRFAEVMTRGSLMMMHGMEVPEREPKPDAARALEILESSPGGPEVIAQLRERGKLKGNPLTLIGYSEPDNGDPWSTRNAEVSGPAPSVMFCCVEGPNGWWLSRFNMPVEDDFLALVNVSGYGTVDVELDLAFLGTYAFAGNDWITVPVASLSAGAHNLKVIQDGGYFYWLGTYYYSL